MNLRPVFLIGTVWCAWCVIWAMLMHAPLCVLLNSYCTYKAFCFYRNER